MISSVFNFRVDGGAALRVVVQHLAHRRAAFARLVGRVVGPRCSHSAIPALTDTAVIFFSKNTTMANSLKGGAVRPKEP